MAALTGRLMKISVDGTDYSAQVFDAHVDADDAESDQVTMAEAAAGGGRQYTLVITLTQDMAAGSLWREIWDNAGTDVDFTYIGHGNATPSATQPHLTGTATIREPNGTIIGGEANASSTSRLTVEVEWPCLAKPTLVTA